MKSLIPLFPFVAALGLLACQGDDGPVAEGAAPSAEHWRRLGERRIVRTRQCRRRRSGRSRRRAALPTMAWAGPAPAAAPASARSGARPLLRLRLRDGDVLRVTRLHPATPGSDRDAELHRRRDGVVAADARRRQARRSRANPNGRAKRAATWRARWRGPLPAAARSTSRSAAPPRWRCRPRRSSTQCSSPARHKKGRPAAPDRPFFLRSAAELDRQMRSP